MDLNFKMNHWSFILFWLSHWMNPGACTLWKDIEKELIASIRLTYFSGITHKNVFFVRPVMLQTFQTVEQFLGRRKVTKLCLYLAGPKSTDGW